MRLLKILSCAALCALILCSSCFAIFAAETPTEPTTDGKKTYAQKTEQELLNNYQVPLSYIIEELQKRIDEVIKDKDGKPIRTYDFVKKHIDKDGYLITEPVPIGGFNLVDFLKGKRFFLSYKTGYVKDSKEIYKPLDKTTVYIDRLLIFDNDPFLNTKQTAKASNFTNYQEGQVYDMFSFLGKPNYEITFDKFTSTFPNAINQKFETFTGENTTFDKDGTNYIFSFLHGNHTRDSLGSVNLYGCTSFYMNFMPKGGTGLVDDFVITDKDLESGTGSFNPDDPNRPKGDYKYGVYEFQNDKMTIAQYFEQKPEVKATKIGTMTTYAITFKGNSYIWNVRNNQFTDTSLPDGKQATTDLFKDYPSTNTLIRFSWAFDGNDNPIYEDGGILENNGYVKKRPNGNYPYLIKEYRNGTLYRKLYFQGVPEINVSKNKYDCLTWKYTNIFSYLNGPIYGPWYIEKDGMFYYPSGGNYQGTNHLEETFVENYSFRQSGKKAGDYVTFNWDVSKYYNRFDWDNPVKDDDLDGNFEENDENIYDDNGVLIGQGDGSKPNKKPDDALNSDNFKFDFETLQGYAKNAFDFMKSAFSIFPAWIWAIIGSVIVILILLRILGR